MGALSLAWERSDFLTVHACLELLTALASCCGGFLRGQSHGAETCLCGCSGGVPLPSHRVVAHWHRAPLGMCVQPHACVVRKPTSSRRL